VDSECLLGEGHVQIYGVSEKEPKLIKCVKIDSCSFDLSLPKSKFQFIYAVAFIKNAENLTDSVSLMTIFRGTPEKVLISEQTTVATIFCFSRFFQMFDGESGISGTSSALEIAYGMKNNFIQVDGVISDVIISNPNGLETNSYPMFNYLSSILYYSFADPSIKQEFLQLTTFSNTIEAMLTVALNPWNDVVEIYDLIKDEDPVFVPALNTLTLPLWKASPIPNQWTLTLKFNNTGSKNFIPGGPGYLIFDKNGRVWINNNARQGTPNSSNFCVILEPNGEPAPFSPLFGGGLLGAGFGIDTNRNRDVIAVGNFGWGSTDYNPQDGSISLIKDDGKILSPSNGFTQGFSRAQGIFYDRRGNLWISGWGSQVPLGGPNDPTFDFPNRNSSVTVYIGGQASDITPTVLAQLPRMSVFCQEMSHFSRNSSAGPWT